MKPTVYDSTGNEKISINILTADTDWVDGGPVGITASTTNPTKGTAIQDKIYWRRNGDSMEIRVEYSQTAGGTAGSGDYLITIPASQHIDASKVNISNTITGGIAAFSSVGGGVMTDTVTEGLVSVEPFDVTRVRVQFVAVSNSNFSRGQWGSSNFQLSNTTLRVNFYFKVPILGWATNDVVLVEGTPASKSDIENETANGKHITPDKARFIPGAAKAWVSFDGTGTPTIQNSYNVSSITDDGVGLFKINFITPFADSNYTMNGSSRYDSSNAAAITTVGLRRQTTSAKSTTSCAIQVVYNPGNSVATVYDSPEITVVFHGNN
jgi:hypothetical protein